MEIPNLSKDELLKLSKSLYGLRDADEDWRETTEKHVCNDLQITSIHCDAVFYIKTGANRFKGNCTYYLNDKSISYGIYFELEKE